MHAAEFEGEILKLCASRGPANELNHVPALLSMEKECLGLDSWRVRLAMTRLPGEPLDDFLERVEAAATLAPPRKPRRRLIRALSLATQLLRQLAPAMDRLSEWVFHRDVHPRNMLIEDRGSDQPPRFGLVDFGLAVDAEAWRRGAWREHGAAGDCRYWPTSAWLVFGHGTGELAERPGLTHEFEARLDQHALGLSALEVLVRVSPEAWLEEGTPEALLEGLRGLRAAWERYWEDVSRFWEVVYGAYTGGKDIGELKVACAEVGVHGIVCKALKGLRAALRELQKTFGPQAPVHADENDAGASRADADSTILATTGPPLVEALLQLISDGDEPRAAPTWAGISALLEQLEDAGSRSGSGSSSSVCENHSALAPEAVDGEASLVPAPVVADPAAVALTPTALVRPSLLAPGQLAVRQSMKKAVKLSDEVAVAAISARDLRNDRVDEVEYTDDDGDLVCFRLEAGHLISYCNGTRGVGVGNNRDSTGIVKELKWFSCQKEGWGGSIANQFNCGGMIPKDRLAALRSLADRAGVPNNIPAPPDELEAAPEDRNCKVLQLSRVATPERTCMPVTEPEPETTSMQYSVLPMTPRTPAAAGAGATFTPPRRRLLPSWPGTAVARLPSPPQGAGASHRRGGPAGAASAAAPQPGAAAGFPGVASPAAAARVPLPRHFPTRHSTPSCLERSPPPTPPHPQAPVARRAGVSAAAAPPPRTSGGAGVVAATAAWHGAALAVSRSPALPRRALQPQTPQAAAPREAGQSVHHATCCQ